MLSTVHEAMAGQFPNMHIATIIDWLTFDTPAARKHTALELVCSYNTVFDVLIAICQRNGKWNVAVVFHFPLSRLVLASGLVV